MPQNNLNKVEEIKSLLPDHQLEIKSLSDLGINIEIPEPHDTIEANAREKAEVIYRLTRLNCFAEDTGLEVDILDGEPGVNSARYAGEQRSSEDNVDKLLLNLSGKEDRKANFKTIICLIRNGEQIIFEGRCKGTIIANRRGDFGFGYDSVFIPDGASKTFGEMTLSEKNLYSHRRNAFEKLIKNLAEIGI